tara:strand:+ start:264 stop:470 length:207 start_codon:yes stop_codon:yes gene_type:complete
MERKSKGTMAYRMKGTTMYNKIAKDNFDVDNLEAINAEAKVKKTKFYNIAEKLKVRKMNRKAKKKFEQ